MKDFEKKLAACSLCFLLLFSSVRLTKSYLHKSLNEKNNPIRPGSIDITLEEPDWNPENAKNMIPQQVVPKNPMVINTGKNEAWVFLEVDIPIRSVRLVDKDTKRKTEKNRQELFLFQSDEKWNLLKATEDRENAHYVYGYQEKLLPNEKTIPLFEEITLQNLLEGELNEEESFTIPVHAFAVQTNLAEGETDLKTIYELTHSQAREG